MQLSEVHRSGPILKNGLDRPENRYGRYGFFAGFSPAYSIYLAWLVDGARDSLFRFSFL